CGLAVHRSRFDARHPWNASVKLVPEETALRGKEKAMRFPGRSIVLAGCIVALNGCRGDATAPTGLLVPTQSRQSAWGPETPNFNLEVVLRGDGFGLVKFRQPNDDALIVNLDIWVRDLEPNTVYVLQRAVDRTLDGVCPTVGWLPL